MKTFLFVKATLLPLPLYALGLWLGRPFEAAALGLLYGVVWALVRYRGKLPPAFETALLLGLALVVAGHVAAVPALVAQANTIVLGSLAVGAGVSLLLRKPWTAAFSASEYSAASRTPLFHSVNMQMSALWAVLFTWLAIAAWLRLPASAYWVPVILGGIASARLPGFLVRRELTRKAAGDQRNAWPAPDFSTPIPAATGDEACDVAIVGAGIGGLTAAALLAQSGLKVSVFEHHVVAGGFAHTWLRRARARDPLDNRKLVFRFDSGVHDVSGWYEGGTVHTLFKRMGIADACKWSRLDHRYVLDGRSLDVPRDWRAYAAKLGEMYPDEARGIETLFGEIKQIFDAMFSTAKDNSGIPGAPRSADAMLAFAKDNPLAVEWMDKPWSVFVARHVKGEGALQWISALTGYISDDKAVLKVADMVPLYGYYFHGGHYPVGGSGVMADSLVGAIEAAGGKVHLRTPVERIVVENMQATGLVVADHTGTRRTVRTRAVICNADLPTMLSRLIADDAVTKAFEAQLGPLTPACSAVAVHLAIRGKLDLPGVVHVASPEGHAGLVVPSAFDPTCAPEGYATLEILKLLPHEDAKAWFPAGADQDASALDPYRNSDDYLHRKTAIGDNLIAVARSVIPDLDARIVYRTDATPLTFQRYAWTQHGSIYGARAGKGRAPVKTPVRNLLLAGAATHGAGVEAVVISGAMAAEALLPGLLAQRPMRAAA